MKKKILAILLVVMMVVSILPVSAFAEGEEVTATCPGEGKTHTLDNCTGAVEKETVEGDCLNWGYTFYQCSVCEDVFADDFVKPADAHKVSNPTEEAVAPTCTDPGKTAAGVCDVCGKEVKSTEVPALGHEKAKDDKGTPCETEDGECGVAFDCVRCDYVIIEEGEHDWCDMPKVLEEPTYFEDGVAEYTCEKCGATKEVAIRCEHDCSASLKWIDPVEPTCTETGLWGHYICTECETRWTYDNKKVTLEEMTRPATGHNFDIYDHADWFGYTTSGTYGNYVDENNWSLVDNNYKSSLTSAIYGDAIWAGFNVNGDFYKANGYHYIHSYVYDMYVEEVNVYFATKALGAGITGPKSVEVLYYDLNGNLISLGVVDTLVMDTDKATYIKVSVPTGGIYVAGGIEIRFVSQTNWTFVSEFEVVGKYLASWNFSGEYTLPTCTKPGSITLPCVNPDCDAEDEREIAKTGHRYEADPVAVRYPTCTTYGYELYACIDCGAIDEVVTLDPLGHVYLPDSDITCMYVLWNENRESACDKYWGYTDCWGCDEYEWYLENLYDYTEDATCLKDGYHEWECGRCGELIEDKIPATGHNEKTITVDATCHQYGYSYKVCTNENCDGKSVPVSVDVVGGANGITLTYYFLKDGVKYILPDTNFTCIFEYAVDVEGGFDPDNHTRDNSKSYWLVEPTCTTGGTDVFFCAYCDFYEITDVDALGHDFTMLEDGSNWEVKTQQTCTTAETWTVYCTKGCTVKDKDGKDVKVSTVITNEKKPALGHKYSDKAADMITTPATCIADGYKFYDCERCSANGKYDAACDKLVEKLDKLVNKAPVDGREEVFNSKAAAEAVHKITSWTVLRKGDCQIVGLEVAKCDLCDLDILAVIPDTGHHVAPNFADTWYKATTINTYNWNSASLIAVADGDASATVVDVLGGKWFTWWYKAMLEQQADGTWVVTNWEVDGATGYENWTLGEGKLVLLVWDGWTNPYTGVIANAGVGSAFRTNLNWSEIANAPANASLIFNYASVAAFPAVNAGCIDNGYTAQYNCTLCGELVESEVVKAAGKHEIVVDKQKVDPTCTEDGSTEKGHCKNCAYTYGGEVIPATGHLRAVCLDHAEASCTQFGYTHVYCPTCGWEELWGYESAWGHNLKVEVKPVECLVDGVVGCTECDYTEVVKAKGHVMTVGEGKDAVKVYFGFCDQAIPANNKCEVCEATVKAGDALVHREVKVTKVDATCVKYGYTLYHCVACDETTMIEDTINGLAKHNIEWDAKKYVAPTFHAAGSKTGTCSVCKGEFTEEVKALEGIGYFVSLDNAVVSGAELVDSATLAVTINLDGNNAGVWGVRFNVEYDKAVLKFDSYEFVCDAFNVLGEVNDNNGYVTVVASMSDKDATGVANATVNADTSFVVLYFTVATNNKVVEDSAITVKPVEAINAEGKPVTIGYADSAKFDVAAYLDANEDGAVNLADALYIYNIVSSGSGEYDASVDVDKDGVITLFDFIAVYKYLSGEFVYADMVNGGVKVAPQA